MSLRQKIEAHFKNNRSGQGSLVGVLTASIILSVIIASATQWYLSMNKTMGATNERLEAMTIAMSEWQRLEHMSLDELEANRKNYKTPYNVGDKFKVGITLGEQGFFDNGTCNALTGSYASESANCFKDTIMTVYDKGGSALFTTRSLPLSVARDSFPEGTILPYTGDLAKIPKGWVLCDGTNGTPDLTGRFLEGTKTATGVFKQAGLPNIKGSLGSGNNYGGISGWAGSPYSNSIQGSGPFSLRYGGWVHNGTVHNPGFGVLEIYFDAARSSTVYGKSDTVQPPSYTVFYIMKTNQDFHYQHTNSTPSATYYTKGEVDSLLKDIKNDYGNKISTISNRLNSNEFIKNLTTTYNLNLRYEKKAGDDSLKLHAYNGNTEIPLFSPDGNSGFM